MFVRTGHHLSEDLLSLRAPNGPGLEKRGADLITRKIHGHVSGGFVPP